MSNVIKILVIADHQQWHLITYIHQDVVVKTLFAGEWAVKLPRLQWLQWLSCMLKEKQLLLLVSGIATSGCGPFLIKASWHLVAL